MATFQDTKDDAEQKVIMHLLSEIERNPSFTQRKLAGELGIALGLINRYLKHCATKGWIRISQVSPRRIGYFLTPEGFIEKSQMVAGYLSRSLTFFRDAREQCEALFAQCAERGWNRIVLLGEGDLADIAQLVAQGSPMALTVVPYSILNADRAAALDALIAENDAFLVTDISVPQSAYDCARKKITGDRLLTLDLLYITTQPDDAARQEVA